MSSPASRPLTGLALVGLQGLIFLAVGLTAVLDGPGFDGSLWLGSTMILLGLLGMFWSGKDLGRALTPMPTPNGAGLAAGGIYGYVRHPMYTSILVIAFGMAAGSGHWWTLVAAAVLTVFFHVKTRFEESQLVHTYPGYAEYAARTGKFVPGVGKRRIV